MKHSPRIARRPFVVPVALTFVLAGGCGGGGGGSGAPAPFTATGTPAPPATSAPVVTPTPVATSTPAATATPSPAPTPSAPLAISPAALAFTAAGQTATVTLSETGYAAAITPDGTACGTIASVGPAVASAPATFTVTARAAGSCALAFSDAFGQRASVAVGVTITQGSIE